MVTLKEICSLKNIMAFPMLTVQLLVFAYFLAVLMVYVPYLKDYYFIHLPIISGLLGLAAISLLQTFTVNPGTVDLDLIEQIKLNLKFEVQEQHHDETQDLD